jgi:hypothetical protein
MKWIKAVRIMVALALLSLGTVQLIASRTDQYERYYYTDATYSEECGGALVFCDGATWWGCYNSPYYITSELPSCSNPGDGPANGGCIPPAHPVGECGDGFDNDNDGRIDGADPQCQVCGTPYES